MKKQLYLFIFLASFFATESQAKNLKAYLSYYTFNTPENEPYLETHISVVGKSVSYLQLANKSYQGSIGITILIKQQDAIIKAEKLNLLSPEFKDTLTFSNFLDQKRFKLPNGKYTLQIVIQDNNNLLNKDIVTQDFEINFPPQSIAVSDIIFLESYNMVASENQFNRNGYEMIPFVNNFLPTNVNKLTFYAEIYNTQKVAPNESFLLSYYIQNSDGLNKLSSFIQQKKIIAKDIIVLLNEFDISLLPSGNFFLVIEVKNRNNEIIASKSNYFQRSNKSLGGDISSISGIAYDNSFAAKYNREQLIENIKCLAPITNQNERDYTKTLLANGDEVQMRQYLIYFWEKRNPGESAAKWAEYEQQVKIVNSKFTTPFQKGYDTDRGIIFLKYGPPNNMIANDFDNRTFPYEIWQYYRVKTFSNRRFVFYSPENIKNDMILLHSNLVGERNDPQWKYKIMSRTMKNEYDNANADTDYFGQRLDADFND